RSLGMRRVLQHATRKTAGRGRPPCPAVLRVACCKTLRIPNDRPQPPRHGAAVVAPAALVIVTVVTVVIIASGHGGSHDTAPAPTTARVQPSSPPRTAPDEPPRPAAAAPRPVA